MSTLLQPDIWLRTNDARLEHYQDSGWESVLYSCRAPDKVSDNEDAAAIVPLNNGGVVMIVADGCGGARGGEFAAQLTIETLVEGLTQQEFSPTHSRGVLLDAIDQANDRVLGLGMGSACTLAVVELFGDRARAYHVGDAQVVVCNNRGRVRYQSTSHSPVGYAVAAGMLGSRQALQHQRRHVVSNVVGNESMKVEIGPSLSLSCHDRILIASDGLYDNLFLHEIVARLARGPLRQMVPALASLATLRMHRAGTRNPSKPDDMTIVTARLRA